jgi:outer membrane protein assembly factor BamB
MTLDRPVSLPLIEPVNVRRVPGVIAAVAFFWLLIGTAPAKDPDNAHPLSLSLQELERDLTSKDYLDVLATMIPTDLAAEWQRVATSDNYHLFAKRHGGMEKVMADSALKLAYERRHQIATRFLDLMRRAYAAKKLKPPFDDGQTLTRALESAEKRAAGNAIADLAIRAVMTAPGAEKEWPCFRGPTGQSVILDTDIPLEWGSEKNVLWRTKLPGRGNSSPVIWGNRLFITAESEPRAANAGLAASDRAPDRLLLCYAIDRDSKARLSPGKPAAPGTLLWRHAAPRPAKHEILYWKNTLASSTPVTDGERVIVFFGNAGLVCCDMTGERKWHADLGAFPTMHGPGSTPVLYHDLVIVIQEQNTGTSLCAAYDKRTGKRVWQRPRPNSMGWSSPLVLRVGDRDELIHNGSNQVVAYDPRTGDELWRAGGTSIEAIPMIVSGDGRLYSFSGRNGPMFALRPGGHGDITDTHVLWRQERGGPHVPTPAYHDGRLYVVSDTGILACLDAATGELVSQKRLRGRFSMSPLVVGDKLLLLNEDGMTYVIRCGKELQVLQQNDLGEPTLATPAVVGGRIYFRTADHLVCVGRQDSKVD